MTGTERWNEREDSPVKLKIEILSIESKDRDNLIMSS
jgi:hypothetical protein